MGAVFGVKIKKERINWAEDVRKFIEERLRRLEAESNFESVLERLEKADWRIPAGFSASSVREDRDSN